MTKVYSFDLNIESKICTSISMIENYKSNKFVDIKKFDYDEIVRLETDPCYKIYFSKSKQALHMFRLGLYESNYVYNNSIDPLICKENSLLSIIMEELINE